ncbi:anti-sigma factor family protein [Granulosicoccus antarcticus]|uniref:Putative zinc-finger domain-containing protein n=1 Tax=Granulosicoccus antarcticus IMCC3135 TaxID=1192854 RepID=A0A2Z2NQ24_9GAMM|nr:zf-HC2 domain-containing protein [Granulosicoccus antarcticus]ASJ73556.1 hypothetical protein IMCC3135_17370 [Granulosicoccus antarcticus IMCC3135]
MKSESVLQRTVRWLKGQMLTHMPGMLTCRQFEDFILAYLDGELTRKQVAMFEMHLLVCRECRDYLASYKRTVEINKVVLGLPDDAVPDEVPADLIAAILKSKQ